MTVICSGNYHTCALQHFRVLMTLDTAKMIAHDIVRARLDYNNALLHDM